MSRQPGWYWVRAGADEAWEVAEWNGGTWEVTGTDHDWPDHMIKVVGPRIPTPDEMGSWRVVPKAITAEAGYKSALIGEFIEKHSERCPECEAMGDEEDCIICLGTGEVENRIPVSWVNIKAIHKRIVEIAAAQSAREGG